MANKSSRNKNRGKGRGKKNDFRPRSQGFRVEKEEPKKDDKSKRVNLDNERTSKFVRNFVQDMEEDSKRGNNNDISTWNKNEEFMKSAGSIPFSSIVGDPLLVMNETGAAVPGIMVLSYSPTIGSATDPVAVNKCFEAMYSFMIHANSRDYRYDFPDVAMMILAAAQIYMAIAEAQRIYGLYKSYQEPNRYLVDPLVQALGWNPQTTRKNLNKMWFDLNDLILQTRQLWIPDTIPVIQRWIDISSHVYKDADSERAQLYAFRFCNLWQFEEKASITGTCLMPALYPETINSGGIDGTYINWNPYCNRAGSSLNEWDNYREMIQRMINKIVASQDRGSFFGDILKAYGGNHIIALKPFDADYSVSPEPNAMILAQVENATRTGMICKGIMQNPNGLLSITPVYSVYGISDMGPVDQQWLSSNYANPSANLMGTTVNQILNFHGSGQPTPEWVTEATRFKATALTVTSNNTIKVPTLQDPGTVDPVYESGDITSPISRYIVPTRTSTELINDITIFTRVNTGTGWTLSGTTVRQFTGSTEALTSAQITSIKRLMAFDWHPFLYDVDFTLDPSQGLALPFSEMEEAYGDFDNYTTINVQELARLHRVAIYSAFGVPMTVN